MFLRAAAGLAMVLLTAPTVFAAARETVLFDTDSGPFNDDGAALVMLLRSPAQVTVAGVTVVPGNVWPEQGAGYMARLLDLLKRPEVPLFTGAETPLVHSAAMAAEAGRRWGKLDYTGAFAQDPAAAARPGGRRPHSEAAVQFLISEIERRPGQLTVLALGPMTNIALALRLKPEIETRIKQIVWMGGNIKAPGNASAAAEFNFWFDPEAARIVLRSRIPKKVMFALDICNTAQIRKPEFDRIVAARTPITELYREDSGGRYPGFLQHPDAVGYLWDELAAAYLLDPGFVTRFETRYLDVQTAWTRLYGATIPLDRRVAPQATPVEVMLALDFPRVFALYRELLTRRD
jgi:inosine-uridine nucleoside N-ribohydrolase